mmetsp:Transcript_6574/g.18343  ORF Transcript_6574/g.18343 Transcript_6574/m.18343 type:complete len:337 (+) Transcript_6574:19-1029(+)
MGKSGKKRSKKSKAPVPLAPPSAMKSRRVARVTTTLFHQYTRERDLAQKRGDAAAVAAAEQKIEEMGGREAYQKASQLNTSHHSTSKWVLGVLGARGWLQGMGDEKKSSDVADSAASLLSRKGKVPKRNARLLEVGAINRELLDASVRTRKRKIDETNETADERVYRLDCRAIDLRSSQPGIEEADFLQLPLVDADPCQRYDAIVCSMVINCVPNAPDRGRMLALLYHQLRPGGLCFLTLPRLCLTQSKYVTTDLFRSMLTDLDGVGFELVKERISPKVAFFVLKRPDEVVGTANQSKWRRLNSQFTKKPVINKAKKFRNEFGVVLDEEEVNGKLF